MGNLPMSAREWSEGGSTGGHGARRPFGSLHERVVFQQTLIAAPLPSSPVLDGIVLADRW